MLLSVYLQLDDEWLLSWPPAPQIDPRTDALSPLDPSAQRVHKPSLFRAWQSGMWQWCLNILIRQFYVAECYFNRQYKGRVTTVMKWLTSVPKWEPVSKHQVGHSVKVDNKIRILKEQLTLNPPIR